MRTHAILLTIFFWLLLTLAGCTHNRAAPSSPNEPIGWTGTLNARDGKNHNGSFALKLHEANGAVSGSYNLDSDRCIPTGEVSGLRRGDELLLTISLGSNIMTVNAAMSGQSFYGKYTFTQGDCTGEWGSIVGQRVEPK